MNYILHPENLYRVPLFGKSLVRHLQHRAETVAQRASEHTDPNISVVIRSRNNAEQLAGLLEDIAAQDFSGEVQVVVVDTESSDGTAEIAKNRGAEVISIRQKDFTYPKALNLGFAAAKHAWVFSFVDHSALVHTQTFKIVTGWEQDKTISGIWGMSFPSSNASWTELLIYMIGFAVITRRKPHPTPKRQTGGGMMGANTAVFRRDVWEELGKFDESYGAGGEDSAFGSTMLKAGYTVLFDPAMTVYHTHGLGPLALIQQLQYWKRLGKPAAFDHQDLKKFRGSSLK